MAYNILHTYFLHIYLILSSKPLLLSIFKPHWLSLCSLNIPSLFLSLYLCTCSFLLELSYLVFSHSVFSLIFPSQRILAWFANASHSFTLHPSTVKRPVCVAHCLGWCLASSYYSVNIDRLIQWRSLSETSQKASGVHSHWNINNWLKKISKLLLNSKM